MAFDQTLMAYDGVSFTSGIVTAPWRYGPSPDNIATIEASGYFDAFSNQLKVDDTIIFKGSDGMDLRRVSDVSPNVTIVAFITAGDVADGSITPDKISPLVIDSGVGSAEVVLRIDTPGGASLNKDVILVNNFEVTSVFFVLSGLGTVGDTIQLINVNSGNPITNAVSMNAFAPGTTLLNTLLIPAEKTIASGDAVRIAEIDGGGSDSPAVTSYVRGHRVL